jgi:hypothetical protein
MQARQTSLEPSRHPIQLDISELEEGKIIIEQESPSAWIITQTVKTTQIRTQDIKVVRAMFGKVLTDSKTSQLEKEFNERANRWEKESSIHSSPGEKFLHKDYLRIIGKGESVVPLILKRMETSKKDWLFALEHIVPEEENPAKGIENFRDAVEAWIDWGKRRYRSVE